MHTIHSFGLEHGTLLSVLERPLAADDRWNHPPVVDVRQIVKMLICFQINSHNSHTLSISENSGFIFKPRAKRYVKTGIIDM